MTRKTLAAQSILFLALPSALFCLTWLRWEAGIPLAIMLVWACTRWWQMQPSSESKLFSWKKALILGATALAWCLLAGIGGYFFQRGDYDKHNAIFQLLVNEPWPVRFGTDPYLHAPSFLSYYMAYYLPAAWMGKLFGIAWVEIASLLWATWGTWLALCWAARTLPRTWAIAIVIFFGGLDALVIGFNVLQTLLEGGLDKAYLYHIARTGWEVAFANKVFRYMSHTAMLTWSPQVAIGAWLSVCLIWDAYQRDKSLQWAGFFLALQLLYAPFSVAGLGIFTALLAFRIPVNRWWNKEACVFALPYTAIMAAFYLSHESGLEREFTWESVGWLTFLWKYPLFLLLEFGVYALVFLKADRKWWGYEQKALFGCLAVFALFKMGYNNDLLIQMGVPLLFLLSISFAEQWFRLTSKKLKVWALVILLIGAINPIRYGLMSLTRPILEPTLTTSISVEASPHFFEVFKGREAIGKNYIGFQDAFFYRYLAKSKKEE